MPIVYIAIDAKNEKVPELYDLIDYFDYVYELNDTNVNNYVNNLSLKINMKQRFIVDKNIDHYTDILLNLGKMKSGNVLIIANKNYFDLVLPNLIKDDWETGNLN